MTSPDRTPTGGDPQLGRPFQILVWIFIGATLVSQVGILASGQATSTAPGLFLSLWVLSVIFALIGVLRDMFRPGRAVAWLILGALLIAVMVVSGSGQGDGGWRIPLFFEMGTGPGGHAFTVIPLADSFSMLPYSLFVTLGDLAFWAIAVAWVLTLITWRKAPKPRDSDSTSRGVLGK